MNALAYWLIASAPFVLIAWAWAFARKATAANAKAEVYQEIADAWGLLRDVAWMRDKQRQKAERVRGFLTMALCNPDVCDALEEALEEARRYWKHKPKDEAA